MAEPYLCEIRIVSFNFPPKGWAFCNGQLLPINQNQALFSLLGTTYGGDGITTFALPDLQGRTPMHFSNSHVQGEKAGESSHTLAVAELPSHRHPVQASTTSDATNVVNASGNFLAGANNFYTSGPPNTTLHPATVANSTGGQPHENMQPYLALNFCIALQGIFPSRN